MNQIRFVVRGQEVAPEEMKEVVRKGAEEAEHRRAFEAHEAQRAKEREQRERKRAEYVSRQRTARVKQREHKERAAKAPTLNLKQMVERWEEALERKEGLPRLTHVRIEG